MMEEIKISPVTEDGPTGIEGLKCPTCGEKGTVYLIIEDGTLSCRECCDDIDPIEAKEAASAMAAKWAALAVFLAAFPKMS